MNITQVWQGSFVATLFVVSTPSWSDGLALSGTVLGSDGKGLAGVAVSLAVGKSGTITDAAGNWNLGSPASGIASRAVVPGGSQRLVLDDGHLAVRFDGQDLSGRGSGRSPLGPSLRGLAARSSGIPDTLLYSWKGTIRLRDTISASMTGIVRILDTADAPAIYDFTKGSTLASQGGWRFADTSWKLDTVPGSGGTVTGLPFRYKGAAPGGYGMTEMRFAMPRGDEFWISFRWHVPANFLHRHDTRLTIPLAERTGWALGDTVVGTDSASWGVISEQDSAGIFLRFALKSSYNGVWNGTVRNRTRAQSATASGRSQWPANNKLLAVWADDYSARGTGSTIVWQTDLTWPNADGDRTSALTVGHSVGDSTVTGGPAYSPGMLRAQDAGKWIDLMFHGRFASSRGAKDGVIESWYRRQDDAAWTKAHEIRNANLNRPTVGADSLRTWGYGYLMGWANSGFDSTTTFSISRLEYSYGKPAMLGNTP